MEMIIFFDLFWVIERNGGLVTFQQMKTSFQLLKTLTEASYHLTETLALAPVLQNLHL